jgi:phage tail-like protein
MALNESNPIPSFYFGVEIDGLRVAIISRVSGLGADIEVEEYREGGVNGFIHKFPKVTKNPNLVLEGGITTSTELYDWFRQIVTGNIEKKIVTITLFDQQKTPKRSWSYKNCFPISWKGPELKSDSNTMAFQSLEIVHGGPAV